MTVRWTPQAIPGWSRTSRMACSAQGQGAIRVVDRTTPSVSVRRMAALIAWDIPKSSALTMSRRASAGYPSSSLAPRCDTDNSLARPLRRSEGDSEWRGRESRGRGLVLHRGQADTRQLQLSGAVAGRPLPGHDLLESGGFGCADVDRVRAAR